ncbi:uncharacterized protein LOC131640439 [Vicia villosa]|uniref:uncharacterized protein LOC131640439 n=1 Tax=Vicia villosa TaxID=3911 RepID=UPI00273C54A9|nr:uncharacterized protein LOC131640439 [Vicia villosa]
MIGERIESGIKAGKGHAYQRVVVVTIPNAPLQQQQQQRYPSRQYQQKPRAPRNFDPIPMTYAQLLAHLLHRELVQLRTMGPPPAKLPPNYDANAHCDFHSGAAGHDIERCIRFMHKVQDLIDSKAIEFTPTQGPNVVQNPMPPHGTHAANAIEVVEDARLVKDVTELGSLLPLLKIELLRMGLYSGFGELCTDCMAISSVCDKGKSGIQQLIDNGYLQFEHVRHPELVKNEVNVVSIPYTPAKIPIPARAPPLVITLPGPVPYTSERAIPWNNGAEVFYQGTKHEIEIPVEKEDVDNVVGIGRMTRSGRIFNPPQNARDDNAEALTRDKGKRVAEDTVDQGQSSKSEDTVAKEMEEFLKIIKKSEYKVVDQLSQTQSKISILQLLLCSETHRNALLKLLSTAFVPPEISVNQLEGVVSNINAGRNHNRALHISVECKGTMLSRVLVDTGSSLNVLPKSSLMRLDYSGIEIRPSELTVRAFDGSKRSVFGEVDLPIMIGPQLFTITFFVMDIHPSYSCLLGRPWIHATGVVTSTLHQKLKFVTQGKIVTICGEEEHVVSHLASFRYIEVEGEVHETPCQAFEAVQTIKIPYVENKKLEAPMSPLKEAKAVVESGHPEGWGRVLDLPIKQDKCGIGYQLGQSSSNGAPKKPGTFVPIKFSSADIVKDHICVADDDMDSDYDIEEWIKPCVPGQKLLNWSSKDIISISLDQKSISPPDSVDNDLAMPRYDFDNPINTAEERDKEDCELPDELARLLKQEEKVIEPHQEPIETVNLGTEEMRREVKIGASLNEYVKEKLIGMLKEYSDIVAWSYEDMPGLDTDIVLHRLPLKKNSPPINGDWETRHPNLIPYREHVVKLAQYFDEITFDHIPREENHLVDALATLASMFKVKWDNEAPSIVIKRLDEPAFYGVIDNVPDEKPWFYDIKKFLETQEYPEGASLTDRKTLKRLSAKFFLAGGVLYKRNFDSVLLRCVDGHEAAKIMQEVHKGSFGTHASGHTLARKILRAGATPFSLVYGMEAILPVEVEIPSLRVLTDVKLSEADRVQTRFDQLNLIDEKSHLFKGATSGCTRLCWANFH